MNIILIFGIFILISLFSGVLFNKLKFPRTTGYILIGFFLSLITIFSNYSKPYLQELQFYINEFAISIILFEFGLEITSEHLKKIRGRAFKLTLFQVSITFSLVFLTSRYILGFNNLISMLLATFAIPTAPDIVMFVMKERKIKNEFFSLIEDVVLFDDFIAEIAFFLIFPFFKHSQSIAINGLMLLLNSSLEIILSIIFGTIMGLILVILIEKFLSRFQTFTLVTGFLMLEVGASIALHLHSIIVLLISGVVYSFSARNKKIVTNVLTQYDVLFFILFLMINGFAINFKEAGVLYFPILILLLTRFAGKFFGGYFGHKFFIKEIGEPLKLGISLLPQSTISIYFVAHSMAYIGPLGTHIYNFTMIEIIIFEIFGSLLLTKLFSLDKKN